MKLDSLGLNHLLSAEATCHTVRPLSPAWSSGHLRTAPPKSSSCMPKWVRYQPASAARSPLLLKNTPPIPVTMAIVSSCSFCGGFLVGWRSDHRHRCLSLYHSRSSAPTFALMKVRMG